MTGALVLILVALVTVWDQTPTAPRPADSPGGQFSADRAHGQIERFATAPHPVGTAEHERVRDYLVDHLRSLGLDPRIEDSIGVAPPGLAGVSGLAPVARVRNIVTVIKGTDASGTVLLAAHYDSVPSGPGANDDGAGVATILEVARALTRDPAPPRNDIVLLITDGEELGLLGAEAYTRDHPRGDSGIVLNQEARGASGPVVMFRATRGSAALTRLFARVAPDPVAYSVSSTLFRFLPNDTDFTALRTTGLAAMDFAYIRDSARYHSALDSPAHVDRRSVQQMGDNALAMTRALAGADLVGYLRRGGDDAYFTVPPGRLIYFGAGWAWILVALSIVLVGVLVARVRASGDGSVRRLAGAVVAVAALLGLTVVAGVAYWFVLRLVRPEVASFVSPWEPLWWQAGAVAVAAATLGAWYAVVRRLGVWALSTGAVLVLTAVGVAGVLVSPQLAPLLVPAPCAVLGALVARSVVKPFWQAVALTVGLTPAMVLVLAMGWICFDLGLLFGMIAALGLIVLSLVLMLPLVSAPQTRRSLLVAPGLALAAAVVLTAAGTVANAPDAARPSPARLAYVLDADTGRASWAVPVAQGGSVRLDPWQQRLVGTALVDNPAPDPALPRARVGPAPRADLAPPQMSILRDATAGGVRTVTLRVQSGAARAGRVPEGLVVAVDDPQGRVSAIVVAGREIIPKVRNGTVGVHLHGMPGPVEVELRFAPGPPLRVRLADVDQTAAALSAVPGYQRPPAHLYLRYSWLAVTISRVL